MLATLHTMAAPAAAPSSPRFTKQSASSRRTAKRASRSRRGLGVYALPSNARPAADTPVLHSPVLNVFLGGQLCWGNIAKPKALSVAAMAEYERAVFDSWSTHPNAGQDQTVTGKGGLVRLWDDLAARQAKRFPVRRLKTFFPQQRRPADLRPITVAQLIEWAC
ncbi:PRTRC system protein B [Sphingomonas elodea]|uniref:PRTRC system protein B n=1 Tax=Sphingomonas elodea TaxID=179878 RepID=UPI000263108E|nr:PRTRC system protein B [Sphingomonas elodea]